MGILLCEQNFRDVWSRNESVRAEIGQMLHTDTRGYISSKGVNDCLPTKDELDSEPLVEELSKAIDSLASDEAPGNDGIHPDFPLT